MPDHHPVGHQQHAGQGAVVVDIGGDVGALVVRTDATMEGDEIEISPVDDDAARSHVAVHRRPPPAVAPAPGHVADHSAGQGTDPQVYAAVYPALHQGKYRLWHPDGRPPRSVSVTGGCVTDVAWRDLAEVGA